MNKQCDIFTGSKLSAVEKHELEKELKEKEMKNLFGNVRMIDEKKEVVKEVANRDFIRTNEEVLQVKYKMRGLLICTSIISDKECWVEEKLVKSSSKCFLEVLQVGDRLLIRNDNGILIESQVDLIYKNKKRVYKVVVKDVKDGEVMCVEQKDIVRVLTTVKAKKE